MAQAASDIEEQVRVAWSVPDLLSAAFDALEVIRVQARASELRDPGLFAAFMATASAAVDGREALTAAPSLPPGTCEPAPRATATARTEPERVAADLAALGLLLAQRLTLAADQASDPGDRAACAQAAEAAWRVHGLMAGDGDGRLW